MDVIEYYQKLLEIRFSEFSGVYEGTRQWLKVLSMKNEILQYILEWLRAYSRLAINVASALMISFILSSPHRIPYVMLQHYRQMQALEAPQFC
ncbi:hypothetical protein BCON_0003g00920 [Botryotinia convoluta]|uniref:Uncharacterized protein n=1 Tax=Botryotinia convoluta TaxID=54673 RepID=A0A4Z1J8M7_9HELO|nr:hypothetical protein BCON_0003g00920 [Botryotinia convoluta]